MFRRQSAFGFNNSKDEYDDYTSNDNNENDTNGNRGVLSNELFRRQSSLGFGGSRDDSDIILDKDIYRRQSAFGFQSKESSLRSLMYRQSARGFSFSSVMGTENSSSNGEEKNDILLFPPSKSNTNSINNSPIHSDYNSNFSTPTREQILLTKNNNNTVPLQDCGLAPVSSKIIIYFVINMQR